MLLYLLPLKYAIVMAGSDIAMNQFQIVSDAPFVYVELADGSQGKIKKSDLANVMNTFIGGLFPKLFSTTSA